MYGCFAQFRIVPEALSIMMDMPHYVLSIQWAQAIFVYWTLKMSPVQMSSWNFKLYVNLIMCNLIFKVYLILLGNHLNYLNFIHLFNVFLWPHVGIDYYLEDMAVCITWHTSPHPYHPTFTALKPYHILSHSWWHQEK